MFCKKGLSAEAESRHKRGRRSTMKEAMLWRKRKEERTYEGNGFILAVFFSWSDLEEKII